MQLLEVDRLCAYLAPGRWSRRVHANAIFQLGGFSYSAGYLRAGWDLPITFFPAGIRFVAQPTSAADPLMFPAQGLAKADLMGELTQFLHLPEYQLALPLGPHYSRQLAYSALLTDTTL